MSDQSNIARLEAEGVLDSSNMSDDHKTVVNSMSDDEVASLIAAHAAKSKLNPAPWKPASDGGAF